MADEDDGLGSFFDEISKIPVDEKNLAEAQSKSYDNDDGTRSKRQRLENESEVVQVVVAAKPQLIIASQTSHTEAIVASAPPVTTAFSGGSGSTAASVAEKPTATLASAFSFNTTTTSTRTPLPYVPRQDKEFVRTGGGETWVDDSLKDWPDNDFRLFVGDLAKEVSTEHLTQAFSHYKSFARAKVIRSKYDSRARGFGFVSFLDPMDCAKALREQNGKYLASRPMKISKSNWKDRDLKEVRKKEKKKEKMYEDLGLR